MIFQSKQKLSAEKIVSATFVKDQNKGLFIGFGKDLKNKENPISPIYVPWKKLNGHLVVFGTTRVGKTRLMMSFIDQMIKLGMDLFIVDPKGSEGQEILAWVLEYAETHGKMESIKYISPMFVKHSLSFNPLYYLSNEEISSLIKDIIMADEDFYKSMGADTVYAICLALDYIEKTSPRERIEKEIRSEYDKLKNEGEIVDEIQNIMDPDLATRVADPVTPIHADVSIPPLRSLVTFADLNAYSSKQGMEILKSYVEGTNEELADVEHTSELRALRVQALASLEKMIKKPDDYFIKVGSSYETLISQLSSGRVGGILSTTKINPIIDMLYDPNKSSIFVVQPFPLVFKQASDALVKIFFGMLTSLYGRIGATGRVLPRQVGLCVDEGGSVLYPGVETLFNKAGGLGLRIMIFTQAFSDFDAVVGEDVARIISDNTNIKIYLRMNDEMSRERVSKSFGVLKQVSDSAGGTKRDVRSTVQRAEENILNDSHVAELPEQHFLFQEGPRKVLIKGPFVPDAKYFVEMPIIDAEVSLDNFAERIREYRETEQSEFKKKLKLTEEDIL